MPVKPGSRKRTYAIQKQHTGPKMQGRERSKKEYHTWKWTKESRLFRKENPLCKRCFDKGIIKQSQVTDHIKPVEIYPDFWDKSNWQPLCKDCNIIKGNEDKRLINEYRKTN